MLVLCALLSWPLPPTCPTPLLVWGPGFLPCILLGDGARIAALPNVGWPCELPSHSSPQLCFLSWDAPSMESPISSHTCCAPPPAEDTVASSPDGHLSNSMYSHHNVLRDSYWKCNAKAGATASSSEAQWIQTEVDQESDNSCLTTADHNPCAHLEFTMQRSRDKTFFFSSSQQCTYVDILPWISAFGTRTFRSDAFKN